MIIVADENIPYVKQAFETIGSVTTVPGRRITAQTIHNADILLVRSITKVNKQLLKNSTVKFIATATIGFDHVDTEHLKERKIGFASAPGSNSNSVSEYILAALLVLNKRKLISLQNLKVGVIGIGNVGSKVVRKLKPLGITVLQNDPPKQELLCNDDFSSLDELMECDVVTLHVPLTYSGKYATARFFDEYRINKMKKGSILINSSRGEIVDGDALKQALKSGHLKTTVLDVWENEPNIDTELLDLTAIGTPHIAGYSFDGKVNGTVMIYKSACEFFSIKPNWEPKIPLPEVSEFTIENITKNNLFIKLTETVQKVYNIEADAQNLRQISGLPVTERGIYFDKLRKEYQVRREFPNIEISIKPFNNEVKSKVKMLGFKIAD